MIEATKTIASCLNLRIFVGLLATTATITSSGCDTDAEDLPAVSTFRAATQTAVLAVAPSEAETWAVLGDGQVKGWGLRFCDANGCPAPQDLPAVPLPGPATTVRSNDALTAALLADGTVYTWGPTAADVLAPQPLSFEGTVVELGLGADFLCARLDDGTVPCQSIEGVAEATWLSDYEPVTGAVEVSAGIGHACARQGDGAVLCWGDDTFGQLGSGTTGEASGQATIAIAGQATQLAAGGAHTCALMHDGTVTCWGDGTSGQLGHPGPHAGSVGLPEPATQLTAGAEHTCALAEGSDSLYCWGNDDMRQLGEGSDDLGTIRRVALGELVPTRIFAGPMAYTTFGLFEQGSLRGWGLDDVGQAGYGDLLDHEGDTTVRAVGNLPDVIVLDISEE